MLNQAILVGRLTSDLEITKNEDGRESTILTLAVQRNYKNADGIYETDFVPCVLWNTVATNTAEYCKKGDIIGVKGRIQTSDDKVQIIAEKVTFLSSKSKED